MSHKIDIAPVESDSRIVALAKKILMQINGIDAHMKHEDLSPPSFDKDGPTNMVLQSPEMERARITTLSSLMELQDLLAGPIASLMPNSNPIGLEAIYRWRIAQHVPVKGSIPYDDLAIKCGLKASYLRRILRFAMAHNRCFRETEDGSVAHSAASLLLAQSSDLYDTVGMMFDESWQAFARTCDALEISQDEEPTQTGYSLAHGRGKSVWECHALNPARSRRFARAMDSLVKKPGLSLAHLVTGFDWSRLPDGARIVDMGGSHGHASRAVSQAHPRLEFIVQDLPDVISHVNGSLTNGSDATSNIKFQAHDFFQKQQTEADVFLFRWVLHDWPDQYVVRIFQNLRAVLRPGDKILINDSVMPEPGRVPLSVERHLSTESGAGNFVLIVNRHLDLCMMSLFNSKERQVDEWKRVVQEADERFRDIRVWTPPGATLSFIESTWT